MLESYRMTGIVRLRGGSMAGIEAEVQVEGDFLTRSTRWKEPLGLLANLLQLDANLQFQLEGSAWWLWIRVEMQIWSTLCRLYSK